MFRDRSRSWQDSDIKGVLVTHCEASNAVINDIEAVGKITEKHGRLW